ncbi:MAG: energy-coupling factor transporter transmembrane component T [Terrisporobacter sp.]|uniref:energy-coupling factor transporter transmembrane component T n=1 Tax=Terrisporobacter sp. TaxID=1965305 RepID=UPI002FC7790F
MNKTISQRSLTSNQKFMVFILAMTMFGLSDLVTQIIPEFSIGFIELRVPYFAFIAVSLAILFDPLSVALGAAFGGVIFGGLFISQNITTGVLAVVIGGQIQAFTSLFIVSLKLLIISLSTICIFTSVDPEKLSDALLKFGLPAKFGFGISYGYRMIPILIDEYNNIFNSFRLRGQRPKEKKVWGLNIVMYYIKILMKAFYPMILNTAKRIRSTVEALETKGFTESIENPKSMELKLSYMAIGKSEYTFLIISTALVGITLTVGNLF